MSIPLHRRLLLAACTVLLTQATLAADPLWLSDRRPRANVPREGHDHAATATNSTFATEEEQKNRGVRKQLWLRRGDDVRAANHLPVSSAAQLQVIDAHGRRREVATDERDGLFHATVVLPELGFYNTYLVQESVAGGVRRVEVAKAELLNGTCCRKDVEPQQSQPIRNDALPLELVRDHHPDEALMTRITSGDRVELTVLHYGKPIADVPVTVTTHEGWSKRLVSGADGRVAFTMIRDYFPPWHDFNRRQREDFLLTAELETPERGRVNDTAFTATRYTATLAGSYAPAAADYRSYAWGFGLVLFVAIFGGTAVYLYRRRRVRPFPEVRFDETP